MLERYSPVPHSAEIFRHVKLGGGYFPTGRVHPLPGWIEPDRNDREEAAVTGRPPGVSCWDRSFSTVEASWEIRQQNAIATARATIPLDQRGAFSTIVERVYAVTSTKRPEVAIVYDPLEPALGPCAEGHALLEGLARPVAAKGSPIIIAHHDLLDELLLLFSSCA